MFLNKKILALLGDRQLPKFYILIFFTIFIALLETMGIGMVIPLVNIIQDQAYLEKIKDFIPIFKNNTNKEIILIFLVTVCLVFIFKNIFYMLYIYWSNKFNANIRRHLTETLYENFLNQKYNFHLNKSSVELVKNINIDAEDLRFGMHHFFSGIAEFFISICLITLLLFYNLYLTLLIIISCLVIILIYNLFIKKISRKMGIKRFDSMTSLQRHVKETLSNIKIVKIFSTKKFFQDEFSKHNKDYVKSTLIVDVIVNAPRAIIEITVVTLIITILYYSYNSSNSMSVFSSLGLYGLAFFRLMPSFNRMLTAYSYKNILDYTVSQLYNILEESKIKNENNSKSNFSGNTKDLGIESIQLNNVTFSYDNKKNILENIDLEINKNQFVGIMGDSGSGKSTFINLLLGLFEPNKGSVIYNNKIKIYQNLEIFNKRISYVPQNISILEKSVKENIAFGVKKENIDLDKIKKIIIKTKLDHLISKMDKGLDSIINNDNLNISGGELQRIGLARALYFNTDLLVLDEATNSLDVKTENEILEMIYDNFLGKKIIVFITHKKKNLEKSDFIIEIKNQKIERKNYS